MRCHQKFAACVPWQALALVALRRRVILAATLPSGKYFGISRVVVFGYAVSDCQLQEWQEMDPRVRQTPMPGLPSLRGSPQWAASWLGEPWRVAPILRRRNCNAAVDFGKAYVMRKPVCVDGEIK